MIFHVASVPARKVGPLHTLLSWPSHHSQLGRVGVGSGERGCRR